MEQETSSGSLAGRYSLSDHVLTRLVGVLMLAAAIGPWIREDRLGEFARLEALPHEQLIAVLREQATSTPIHETIGLAALVGVALLAANEGIAWLIRIFVIPRA